MHGLDRDGESMIPVPPKISHWRAVQPQWRFCGLANFGPETQRVPDSSSTGHDGDMHRQQTSANPMPSTPGAFLDVFADNPGSCRPRLYTGSAWAIDLRDPP